MYHQRPSIPIIYIPNPFSTGQYREPSTPNSPPTRYEILSQKLFMIARYNGNNSSSSRSLQTEDLLNLSNLPKSSQIYQISEISKSSIIYHSFHQSIQTLQNHTKCRSSVLIILKDKTYQINVSVILDINTAGKTRLYKHAC